MPATEPARAKEVYGEDIPIAIVSALLAASAFLPWYRGEGNLDISVTAWASGNWGPIFFFLGVGSFLLVVLRRIGVAISLPFDEALLHEFAGWLALAGGVIKSRYRPGAGLLRLSWGLWVGLGAAFLLAFLAGRMSPHAPLVRRPKWYRAKGGVLGALLLLALIAGAAVFGTINSESPLGAPIIGGDLPRFITGRLPDCAGNFPLPPSVKPIRSSEQPCHTNLESERPPAEVAKALEETLRGAGWTVQAGATEGTTEGTTSLILTKPRCATVVVAGAEKGSIAIVVFDFCQSASPTPSPG